MELNQYEVKILNSTYIFKLEKNLKNKNISKYCLEKETGLDNKTIQNYCLGNLKRIDMKVMVTICEYLKCELTDILELKVEK